MKGSQTTRKLEVEEDLEKSLEKLLKKILRVTSWIEICF